MDTIKVSTKPFDISNPIIATCTTKCWPYSGLFTDLRHSYSDEIKNHHLSPPNPVIMVKDPTIETTVDGAEMAVSEKL